MTKIFVIDLPKDSNGQKYLWKEGYPIHKGHTENSLNYATVYANENGIKADQEVLRKEHENFISTLKEASFDVTIVPFPQELYEDDDAIFARDCSLLVDDMLIQGNFSVKDREKEPSVYALLLADMFDKKIVELPAGAFLEFGETNYIETKSGTYYFGGISRANKQGHLFVKNLLDPDHFIIIESEGYHLDTFFTPVLNKENELCACIIVKGFADGETIDKLREICGEVILVDPIDGSAQGGELGLYSVNALVAPGVMVNCHEFITSGVEQRLKELGIKRYVAPLSMFRYAGGSVHCLTNEIR